MFTLKKTAKQLTKLILVVPIFAVGVFLSLIHISEPTRP